MLHSKSAELLPRISAKGQSLISGRTEPLFSIHRHSALVTRPCEVERMMPRWDLGFNPDSACLSTASTRSLLPYSRSVKNSYTSSWSSPVPIVSFVSSANSLKSLSALILIATPCLSNSLSQSLSTHLARLGGGTQATLDG